ncbi:MAG: hypothetical protein VB021_05855 [Oscillospiraceae bacterium]|nr:hypothetical protein [Oscillospiraceae bacterium]
MFTIQLQKVKDDLSFCLYDKDVQKKQTSAAFTAPAIRRCTKG